MSPCGSGKTIIGKTIIENYKGHVWFVVHRKELVDQAVDEFKQLNNVEVLMIQSIHKYKCKPDVIIIDEAHHSVSNSYLKMIEQFNVNVIGLTATPVRLNGKPLGDIYEFMINEIEANELIE